MRKEGSALMLSLKKITWKNLDEVIYLSVKPEQNDFIADNIYGIAQSYVALSSGEDPYPFAVYNYDVCVGFVFMAYEEKGDIDEDGDVAEETNFHIIRLMIDKNYQGKGYGRELVKLCIDWIKQKTQERPLKIHLSYNENNSVAKKLYASFGFIETGERNDGNEVIAELYI